MEISKLYVRLVLGCFAITLLPILCLNLSLTQNGYDKEKKISLASKWQQESKGVTYAPSLSENAQFKTLRLLDRLPDINGIILGSSTVMTITEDMFPRTMHMYNFSKSSNSLLSVIAEGEYLMKNKPHIKTYLIPLDWGLGFIYEADMARIDRYSSRFQKQFSLEPLEEDFDLIDRLRDAISYPRIRILFSMAQDILSSKDITRAYRDYFIEPGKAYRCMDGTIAKDFDTVHRGQCEGFRYDGSATFSANKRVEDSDELMKKALLSNSLYSRVLEESEKGVPNKAIFERLIRFVVKVRQQGGEVFFLAPPMLPGLEKKFLNHPKYSEYLQHTKDELHEWVEQNDLIMLDAAQSEEFGCTPDEFIDAHHALPECYRKVMLKFRGLVP